MTLDQPSHRRYGHGREYTIVGLIPKLLCKMVEAEGGSSLLSQVMEQAGLDPAHEFRMNEVYSDDQWWRLFRSAQDTLKVVEDKLYARYAEFFLTDAQSRWPAWFALSRNAREFLERQPRIHNGFATGVQDAEDRQAISDKFSIESRGETLVVHYRSPNRMCAFYVALTKEVLAHYHETATVEQACCMHTGASECEIHIRWS